MSEYKEDLSKQDWAVSIEPKTGDLVVMVNGKTYLRATIPPRIRLEMYNDLNSSLLRDGYLCGRLFAQKQPSRHDT